MRKLCLLLTGVTIIACQDLTKEFNDVIPEEQSIVITSAIDKDTPVDAVPFIVNEGKSNRRMTGPPGSGWNQVWSDEFNNNSLDASKWTKLVSTKSRSVHPASNRDPNLDWWGWTEDNAWQSNGSLWLRSHKISGNRLECGSVNSNDKFESRYGYFEAKIQIADPNQGSHTAFWFQGDNQGSIDDSGADGAEIDVFESVWTNSKTKSVVHIDGYGSDHEARTQQYNTTGINSGYHLFGLLWEPGLLEIYYDGVLKKTYRGAFVPMVEEFIWLSVGASFDYGNNNSGADGFTSRAIGSTVSARVDYVRVWKSNQTPYYRLKNRETNKWFKTYGIDDNSDVKQCPTSQTGDWTSWAMVPTNSGYFYFVNENSGKYFRPETSNDNSLIKLKPTSNNGAWTQWKFLKAAGNADYYYLKNRQTGKFIRPSSTGDNAAILQKSISVTGNWTQWQTITQ